MTHNNTGGRLSFRLRARSGKAVVIAALIGALVVATLAWFLTSPKERGVPITDTGAALAPEQEAAAQAQGEANLGKKEETAGDLGAGPSSGGGGEGNLAPSGGYR